MAESAPCSGRKASLIGARISLFAKLGNLNPKLLTLRYIVAAIGHPTRPFADFAVLHGRREFVAPGFKTLANLFWGLTALEFARLVRRSPEPPEPP